ncbi:MAG: VIT family protein [Candidatus Binatia bacterium]
MRGKHRELHRSHRVGWLRATVLGANDGIVSVASLVVGVAAGGKSTADVLLAGTAGLVAGAMSMAAGEYVSVRSQADTEEADLARERGELRTQPARELDELANIYVQRGLDARLAREVATQLMATDPLAAHARDELGITEELRARPLQAALASAASFAVGAVVPLATVPLSPSAWTVPMVGATTVVALVALGIAAARTGGAPVPPSVLRVTVWGVGAMALTALAGLLFGGAV